MSNKSHVSMELNQCIVCGKTYTTGAILLDRKMRQSMEPGTVTNWGLCTDDKLKYDDNFVALVECDAQKSEISNNSTSVKPEQVYRTGVVAHLKRNVFHNVFNVSIDDTQAVVFVEQGVIEKLTSMTENQEA